MKIFVFASIDTLPESCIALANSLGQNCFFFHADWFRILEKFGSDDAMERRYYVVSDDNAAPLCILPLCHIKGNSLFHPRVLRSFSNFYTMDFAPLLHDNLTDTERAACLAFLASFILEERPAWDVIDIKMLNRGEAPVRQLQEAFAGKNVMTDQYFQFDNWIHRVNGQSAENYYADRPSRMKNTIKRKRKKFEQAHVLTLGLIRGEEEGLDKAIADYQKIYDKSWKGAEAYPLFIPGLMRICAHNGTLRLGLIYADETPVAAQIWIVTGGVAMIYKLAYDEDYSVLSAGSILSKFMMDHAIDEDKVEVLDYGVGSEPYKRDWMTECRQKTGLLIYNRTARGFVAASRQVMGHKWRALTRKADKNVQDIA